MGASYVGEENGKYRNVNVAWETGSVVDDEDLTNNKASELGNNEYKYACDKLLFPMVREFNPDIILISCGFDGGIGDPLGWSTLSPMIYAYMTHKLLNICPNLLVVQEGGYNIDLLGQHASGVVRALVAGP